ncbi:bacterial Ig-like domain-containing protein, partial [Acholeplasma laidlawii]|uniref:bacterial Ig-like domain-containing protein n=1 Tax=Acholeplasma laidlawii TaxID=2148 RepID=UPI000A7AE1C5
MKYIKAMLMMLLLVVLVSCTTTDEVTYEILINETTPTTYEVGDTITYTDFFIIKDSLGNTVTTQEAMLDVSLVDMSKAGSYMIRISYEGVENQVTITVTATEEEITYTLSINASLPTTLELNTTEVDFKAYFTITDSNGNAVEVLESMIDSSNVNLGEVGTYNLVLNYQGLSKTVVLEVVDRTPVIIYSVVINDALPTEFKVGTETVDFKAYFIITDSNESTIEVTDDMLDLSLVDFTKIGTFSITLNLYAIEHVLSFEVTPDYSYEDEVIEDFDILFDLIKGLELNSK